MKLRILNNTIRLRLSITDLKTFEEEHSITGSITFPNSTFKYSLNINSSEPHVSANYVNNELSISVSDKVVKVWIDSDQVGIATSGEKDLSILIEKDFKCLHKSESSERDNFPNPLQKQ